MEELDKFLERVGILNIELISSCVKKTSLSYRPYDPGWYLYKKLNQFKGDKFSDEYLELIYVTLSAWNMNQRAAKLADFDKFTKILKDNKEIILKLENYKIEKLTNLEIKEVIEISEKLMYNLKDICQQNSKIVTFSKCLHFLLPNLIVPIDRKYTLSFFKKNTIPKELDKQFELYKNLFLSFIQLSKRFDLTDYTNQRWNENVPKVIDNIIISYEEIKK